MYSYGMRYDNDSNAITVIDENAMTAITKGYVNGVQLDFSPDTYLDEIVEVSTTSTTEIDVESYTISKDKITNKAWMVAIEDTAGLRDGYFFSWINARYHTNGLAGQYYRGADGGITGNSFATAANAAMGVYAVITAGDEDVTVDIKAKYDSAKTSAIDGDFRVRIVIL